MEKYKVLVVDDEEDICEILQYNLTKAGYEVVVSNSAEDALYKLRDEFHIILLDIMMEGISGLKFAQFLREEYNNNIPIIFVSALGKEEDVLQGFNKGGDDYISKPFSIKEVLARVKAVLSRSYPQQSVMSKEVSKGSGEQEKKSEAEFFEYRQLKLNYANKRLYIDGKEIVLTKKEAEILTLLVREPGSLFSRETILQKVWKDESYVLERTVDVHIARLRKKIGVYGECIVNRSGYGYSFNIK
ncbi:MAG: response regulator transcription factor [Bacteroidales bacterium]|nr:response regulator transcription factor [Bacteroidales bacterium]MBQ1929150.1 response regulator transcription factor [Bacteroidales bacterium]MBQ5783553.1 response regulator transcription factor [Bacteroidales bacterium]